MNSCGAILVAQSVGSDIVDEWPERFEFHRLGRSNQGLQLVRMSRQNVVHASCQQEHAKEMGFPCVRKVSEPLVQQQGTGQPDLPSGSLELSKIAKRQIVHRVTQ